MKAKRNLMLGAASAVILAAAVPAQAADAIMQPPAPPAAPMEPAPVATWQGGYAGAAVGYGFNGSTELDDGDVADVDTDGFVGNAFAGWNWQSGSFVYGVEGDVGYNGMDGEDAGVSVDGGIDGSLRARLGVAATDNVLIYGTAGGAGGRSEVEIGGDSDEQTMWGWTAGAGADVKLTERSFARVEYRYTDLGSETFDVDGVDYDVDANNHKVLVGFGVQF